MLKFSLPLTIASLVFSSCGNDSSSSNSLDLVPLTKENLVGRWKWTKIKVNEVTKQILGTAISEYKVDGSLVQVGQGYYPEGHELEPCWTTSKGIFEISENILTETFQKEVGSKDCVSGDFNPTNFNVKLTATTFVESTADGITAYFERQDELSELDYELISKKFESIELTVDDADKVANLELIYQQRTAGWVNICPRLAGQYDSGFGIESKFAYNNSIYDLSLQWDEGEITNENYNGPTPSFRFDKRNSTSSDASSTPGTGLYLCDGVSDCNSKCSLKFEQYSLSSKSADIEIKCSQLPASDISDQDNLFGDVLTDFTMKVHCDYEPELGL